MSSMTLQKSFLKSAVGMKYVYFLTFPIISDEIQSIESKKAQKFGIDFTSWKGVTKAG